MTEHDNKRGHDKIREGMTNKRESITKMKYGIINMTEHDNRGHEKIREDMTNMRECMATMKGHALVM